MDRRGRRGSLPRNRRGLLGESVRLLGRPVYFLLVNLLPIIFLGILFCLAVFKNLLLWMSKIPLNIATIFKSLISRATIVTSKFHFPRIKFPEIAMPKIRIQTRAAAAGVAILAGLFGIIWLGVYLFDDLPAPKELTVRQPKLTTHILDRNGRELYKIYKEENRSLVSVRQLPEYVIDATVAIEDKDFWNHAGFSPAGIIRSIYHNYLLPAITGNQSLEISAQNSVSKLQGGSTITQQLVKNTLLSPEKTWRRKIRELVLSVWTERTFSKEQILEMYLNEVSYGGTAYGIQEAAQQYFGKDGRDLTLAEAALLAGLPAAPTVYSPLGANPELAKGRQAEVLRRMVEDNYISLERAEEAKAEKLTYVDGKINIKAPHFVMYVRDLLVKEFGEELVNHGGLKVTTTLDLTIQEMAQETVTGEVNGLTRLRVGNGAALVTNPGTGEILAMVGSKNHFDFVHDGQVNVTLRPRQPGASIKPVMYSAALARGFTPASVILDAPITYNVSGSPPYSPVNYYCKFHGPVPLRIALASSYNVPAVKVLSTIGVNTMIDQAELMGIKTWGDRARFGLSLTLGGGEVTMADMAEAYGTLANYGMHVPLSPILRVEDSRENILKEKRVISERSVSSGIAYQLTNILSDPAARAPAFGTRSTLNIPGQQVAVKTGTSNSLRDNWTFGYTTDYLVAAWVGNNDNSPMSYIASGITGAAPIWNKIITKLLSARATAHEFPKSGEMVTVKICVLTGQLACEGCSSREEIFLPGTEPKEACRPETIEEIKKKQEENQNRDRILQGTSTAR